MKMLFFFFLVGVLVGFFMVTFHFFFSPKFGVYVCLSMKTYFWNFVFTVVEYK